MEKWKAFLNKGTKGETFVKKALVILAILLLAYGFGYAFGTFLANIGV